MKGVKMSTKNYLMRLSLVGFVTAVVLGGIELANGATFSVGLDTGYDFDSIQTGIDATGDGDMVNIFLRRAS
jgi:hypothetical protein